MNYFCWQKQSEVQNKPILRHSQQDPEDLFKIKLPIDNDNEWNVIIHKLIYLATLFVYNKTV